MITWKTKSPGETFLAGEKIGQKAKLGDIYLLEGELGAGKTVFAKGVAAGLGIRETVNSPTFPIVQPYTSGHLPLYHFDVYRIEDADEMFETGFEEMIGGDGVCLIEWPERIRELLPEDAIRVKIDRVPAEGENARVITVTGEDGVRFDETGDACGTDGRVDGGGAADPAEGPA